MVMWLMCRGWDKCSSKQPGLVRLDLSIGGGLVGAGEEVFGVVLECEINTDNKFYKK